MAIQTSSSAPSPAESTSASSTGTPTGSNGQLDMHNSIPFSFLVAFLAIFAVFMALGLWARRIVFLVRRQLGLPLPEPPRRPQVARPKKPVLWDVYPDRPVQEECWGDTQPLSLWYYRPPPTRESSDSHSASMPRPHESLPPSLMAIPGGRGPRVPLPPALPHRANRSMLPYRRILEGWRDIMDPMRHQKAKEAEEKAEIEAVQVAVIIAMPSQNRWQTEKKAEAGEDHDAFPGDVAVGISEHPWHMDDTLFETDGT